MALQSLLFGVVSARTNYVDGLIRGHSSHECPTIARTGRHAGQVLSKVVIPRSYPDPQI